MKNKEALLQHSIVIQPILTHTLTPEQKCSILENYNYCIQHGLHYICYVGEHIVPLSEIPSQSWHKLPKPKIQHWQQQNSDKQYKTLSALCDKVTPELNSSLEQFIDICIDAKKQYGSAAILTELTNLPTMLLQMAFDFVEQIPVRSLPFVNINNPLHNLPENTNVIWTLCMHQNHYMPIELFESKLQQLIQSYPKNTIIIVIADSLDRHNRNFIDLDAGADSIKEDVLLNETVSQYRACFNKFLQDDPKSHQFLRWDHFIHDDRFPKAVAAYQRHCDTNLTLQYKLEKCAQSYTPQIKKGEPTLLNIDDSILIKKNMQYFKEEGAVALIQIEDYYPAIVLHELKNPDCKKLMAANLTLPIHQLKLYHDNPLSDQPLLELIQVQIRSFASTITEPFLLILSFFDGDYVPTEIMLNIFESDAKKTLKAALLKMRNHGYMSLYHKSKHILKYNPILKYVISNIRSSIIQNYSEPKDLLKIIGELLKYHQHIRDIYQQENTSGNSYEHYNKSTKLLEFSLTIAPDWLTKTPEIQASQKYQIIMSEIYYALGDTYLTYRHQPEIALKFYEQAEPYFIQSNDKNAQLKLKYLRLHKDIIQHQLSEHIPQDISAPPENIFEKTDKKSISDCVGQGYVFHNTALKLCLIKSFDLSLSYLDAAESVFKYVYTVKSLYETPESEALIREPELGLAWVTYRRGLIATHLAQYDKATYYFDRAMQYMHTPEVKKSYPMLMRGILHARSKLRLITQQYEQAISDLTESIASFDLIPSDTQKRKLSYEVALDKAKILQAQHYQLALPDDYIMKINEIYTIFDHFEPELKSDDYKIEFLSAIITFCSIYLKIFFEGQHPKDIDIFFRRLDKCYNDIDIKKWTKLNNHLKHAAELYMNIWQALKQSNCFSLVWVNDIDSLIIAYDLYCLSRSIQAHQTAPTTFGDSLLEASYTIYLKSPDHNQLQTFRKVMSAFHQTHNVTLFGTNNAASSNNQTKPEVLQIQSSF